MVDASGFYGAPVTKALCGLTLGGFSILSFTGQKKHYEMALSRRNISNPVNMLTTPFVFASFGEVICGLMLLYTFRQLERKMGSIKFASYTIVSAALGLTVQLAFLVVFERHLTPDPCQLFSRCYSHFLPTYQSCPRGIFLY